MRWAPSRLALAPGDVIALTLSGRRRLFEIGDLIDTELRAGQGAQRSIRKCFRLPLLAPRKKPPAIPAALGPVAVTVLDLPALDAIDAGGADAARDVRRSLAGIGGDLAFVRRRELRASPRWRRRHAIDRRDAGRSAAGGPTARWDRANSVRVKLYGGALASISDARVLDGGNAAAVQHADGAWEMLQFANAELVDGRTY